MCACVRLEMFKITLTKSYLEDMGREAEGFLCSSSMAMDGFPYNCFLKSVPKSSGPDQARARVVVSEFPASHFLQVGVGYTCSVCAPWEEERGADTRAQSQKMNRITQQGAGLLRQAAKKVGQQQQRNMATRKDGFVAWSMTEAMRADTWPFLGDHPLCEPALDHPHMRNFAIRRFWAPLRARSVPPPHPAPPPS